MHDLTKNTERLINGCGLCHSRWIVPCKLKNDLMNGTKLRRRLLYLVVFGTCQVNEVDLAGQSYTKSKRKIILG